jgi:hypothetical protein
MRVNPTYPTYPCFFAKSPENWEHVHRDGRIRKKNTYFPGNMVFMLDRLDRLDLPASRANLSPRQVGFRLDLGWIFSGTGFFLCVKKEQFRKWNKNDPKTRNR